MIDRPRAILSAPLALALALSSGCSVGLFDDDRDVRSIAMERLRAVDRTSLAPFQRKVPAATPTDSPAAESPSAVPVRSRFEGRPSVELDLEQCRQTALANNLSLKVARLDPTIAAQRVSAEDARFNSVFTLSSRYSDFNQPTSSQLVAAQSQRTSIDPGVRIPLRTGGTATVTMPWAKNSDNNQFSTLNPSYSSDFDFSISQPLLRNAGRRANTAPLRIAAYNEQASQARTKLEVIRQLAAVDRAYWRTFAARGSLAVRQQQYELAAEQEARAQRRADKGLGLEIDVIRAQAAVADSLEGIILAQNDVLTRQRELKAVVNDPELPIEGSTMVTVSTPPDPVEYEFDRPQLVAHALDTRMEMLELELQIAADAVAIGQAQNRALPLVSLDYTYRLNGLGGSTQDALKTLRDDDFQDWSVGLSAEIPFDNEQARAGIREAILGRLQRLATREARRQAITQETLAALDQIDAAWQRILASRQAVVLNTRNLRAEQRLFDNSKSTSTDVLNATTRLAEAQLSELRAVADYQVAQVDLAFATGTLLGASRVSFDPAPTPDDDTLTQPVPEFEPAATRPESKQDSKHFPHPELNPESSSDSKPAR